MRGALAGIPAKVLLYHGLGPDLGGGDGLISTTVGARMRAAERIGAAAAATDPGSEIVQRSIAIVSVLLIGANLQVKYGLTIALLPVVLLAPVWVAVIARYPAARLLMTATGLAVVWGTLLAWVAATDHVVNKHQEIASVLMLLTAVGAIGVLIWAGQTLRPTTVAILFGVGLGAAQLPHPAAWAANPWKYGFALPVAVIGVTIAGRARSAWLGVVVLGVIGLVSLVSDYRSFAAFCLITILVLTWQLASGSTRARVHKLAPMLMLGAIGVGVYFILSNLLVEGYLGSGLQARSTAQIDASGSLLIGGRPEWAAAAELMNQRPQGYGFGVLPNAVDVGHGDAGLESVNINPAYGYEDYMFAGGFRLHSILADLWAAAGWGGLLLAAVILAVLLHRLATELGERTATPMLVFSTVLAIWALAFGPIFTDLKTLTLALFVGLAAHRPGAAAGPPKHRLRGQLAAVPISRARLAGRRQR